MPNRERIPDRPQLIGIVEDDFDQLYLLSLMAVRAGHSVVMARNTEEAIRGIPWSNVDAAVIDWRLGNGRALEVVQHVRSTNPRCRLVVVTSGDERRVSSALAEGGCPDVPVFAKVKVMGGLAQIGVRLWGGH